jgi:hypothetical protein
MKSLNEGADNAEAWAKRWAERAPGNTNWKPIGSAVPRSTRAVPPERRTKRARVAGTRTATRRTTSTRGDPDDPDPEPEKPRLLGDVLPGYLEQLLGQGHDYLVDRRLGREIF